MSTHVIVGAGPVGSATALLLAEQGHTVRIITRSGSGPVHEGIERRTADAADAAALRAAAAGADVLYNCANPAYTAWATDWPPIADALLQTAEATGAVLVTTANLYVYGPVDHPIVETDPLAATGTKGKVRAKMWTDVLAAHEAGRIRATEARAADFFGPGLTDASQLGERVIPRILAGKTLRLLGDPDAAHSWTYVPDLARTLVVLGQDERAWGRPWHVPSDQRTQREAVETLARLAGRPVPKIATISPFALKLAGVVVPFMRELQEVAYQTAAPFVVDSSATTATFGLEATPMDEALATTLAWWTERLAVAA